MRPAQIRALAGLFLAGFIVFGGGAYAFTQFLVPISHEFNWGRGILGGMMSAFWLPAPVVLISAYAVRRVGIRCMVLIGGLFEAVGFCCMIWALHPIEFYSMRFLMGAGKALTATAIITMTAKWFPRRTGLLIGVVLSGWHFGGLVLAPLATKLIELYGWRTASVTLGVGAMLGMGVAAALMKDPHGRSDHPAQGAIAIATETQSVSRPGTLRRLASLVAIALGTFAFYCGYAGLISQLSPLLVDIGYSAEAVGRAMGTVALSAAAGVLICGGLTQWLSPRVSGFLILVLMSLLGGATLMLNSNAGLAPMISVVVLLGFLIGGGDPIIVESLRRVIEPHRFADAYGWWYLLCLSALACAPVLAGIIYDRNASYRFALFSLASVSSVAAIVWAIAVRPENPLAEPAH